MELPLSSLGFTGRVVHVTCLPEPRGHQPLQDPRPGSLLGRRSGEEAAARPAPPRWLRLLGLAMRTGEGVLLGQFSGGASLAQIAGAAVHGLLVRVGPLRIAVRLWRVCAIAVRLGGFGTRFNMISHNHTIHRMTSRSGTAKQHYPVNYWYKIKYSSAIANLVTLKLMMRHAHCQES